ncbi:hypothetical protein [Methylocapsa sp. S129]|uniref:hypothetical protein n=1 Tax=Methylocapsa sp. S129 TaxID=1641869 RepID=UPI00131DA0B3|nr:hypothetical protein [Methylocapsa sp. S129]
MPWAAWVMAALMTAVWVPVVGEWAADAIMILTSLPIAFLSALSQGRSQLLPNPIISGGELEPSHSPLGLFVIYLKSLGFPGGIWFAILVVLFAWITRRLRAQRSVRGLVNAFILIAGWPVCFWTAMAAEFVLAHP